MGGGDAFLVKFNSSGVRQWGTYYGGSGVDSAFSCTIDSSGNVYMIGSTNSTSGIATAGAHETTVNDGFLVKFNSNGVRQWGTYLEGEVKACAIDASGNVCIVGCTNSTSGIATAGAHQTMMLGSGDAFLVKFNSSGVKQWGTYFGGTSSGALGLETGISCTTDSSGNIYMVGLTSSNSNIATGAAHQTVYGGNNSDAFLVKFNTGGVMQWGTYYGGLGDDRGLSCATDSSGNVYMSGQVCQQFLPDSAICTPGAHQTNYGGGLSDAFLVKFNPSGVRQWGTYYGGSSIEEGTSCAIDPFGNVYMVGYTGSAAGIATVGAHQAVGSNSLDGFLVCFDSSGVRQSGTYYGECLINDCASDTSGNIYIVGNTRSNSGIATPGSHQTVSGNSVYYDAFLVKFNAVTVGINENIQENPNENLFTLYPNPTRGLVNVKIDPKLIGSGYRVNDNTGKVILSGKIYTENTSIDMGNLSAGIYLFSVGENVKQMLKVVKE
jgi:hypothetical protein